MYNLPEILTRSIEVIEIYLKKPFPRTWSALESDTELPHSSLARLLSHLCELKLLNKNKQGLYEPGRRFSKWSKILSGSKDVSAYNHLTKKIAELTEESTAIAILEYNKILVESVQLFPESVNIVPKGTLIHFERDHAASTAILFQLPEDVRKSFIGGEFSKIKSYKTLQNAHQRHKRASHYFDKSISRPGISRIAYPILLGNKPGAIFVAGTTKGLLTKEREIVKTIKKMSSNGL